MTKPKNDMTIKDAIFNLKEISKRTNDEFIRTKLICITEDLSDYMQSPNVGEDYVVSEDVSQLIEGNNSAAPKFEINKGWVRKLHSSVSKMFGYSQEVTTAKEYGVNYYSKKSGVRFWTLVITGSVVLAVAVVLAVIQWLKSSQNGGNIFNTLDYAVFIGIFDGVIGWVGFVWERFADRKKEKFIFSAEAAISKNNTESAEQFFRDNYKFINVVIKKDKNHHNAYGKNAKVIHVEGCKREDRYDRMIEFFYSVTDSNHHNAYGDESEVKDIEL